MKRFFLSFFLSLFCAAYSFAYDVEVDGIYYNLIDGHAEVTYESLPFYGGTSCYSGSVAIPSKISVLSTEYSVTSIGSSAFYNCSSLSSVTIPNSVTSIGSGAFNNCSSLSSVTIPNSVTSIGSSAFYGCSGLSSVTIPNSVTSIEMWAFQGCSGLTSVTIPNSVTSIGHFAFSGCSGLTSVAIPNSVTSIGYSAFYGCSGLTSVTIPNSVTSIGMSAFSGCSNLSSVTIGSGVTSVGNNVFQGCYIEKDKFINNSSVSGSWGAIICDIITDDGLVIKDNAIVAIKDKSRETYIIPNSVTSIDKSAFSSCYYVKSISIPKSVTNISEGAFSGCSRLISLNVDEENPAYSSEEGVLFDKYKTELIYRPKGKQGEYTIPNSVTSIGSSAFYGCFGLTSVTIPNSVTSIGSSAFYGCSGLTSVTIPNSVTSIGYSAFGECSGLTSVTIPNSVTSIGYSAFGECSGLTSVIVPNSVTSIEDMTFANCSGLTSVTIPQSVTSIGVYAFLGCTGLTSVTIPQSVTSIKNGAFYDCTELRSVHCFASEPPTCFASEIFQVNENCVLYVPLNSTYSYKDAWGLIVVSPFISIREENVSGEKCDAPSIAFADGKLKFSCNTPNAKYYYMIDDNDVKVSVEKYNDGEVELSATYIITVFAEAEGNRKSDETVATLVWYDEDFEGDITGLEENKVNAHPVIISSNGGIMTVNGLSDGMPVNAYTTDGKVLTAAKTSNGTATLFLAGETGKAVIVKMGSKSVKVVVK